MTTPQKTPAPNADDAGREWPDKAAAAPAPRPFEERRLQVAAISQGEPMILTLPDEETLDDGEQDCGIHSRWRVIGPKLVMGQWLQVCNDAGSFFGLMRIELIHGGAGAGLRGLVLRFIAPPYKADKSAEAPIATGEPYVRWGGAYLKWQVIRGNGKVAAEQINTESEARVRLQDVIKSVRAFVR